MNDLMRSRLCLREDGSFRMLMISDIQERLPIHEATIPALCAMLDRVKPDLVILGGDNVDGRYVKSAEELDIYFSAILPVFAERNIPLAHIYGNHDYDADLHPADQLALYRKYGNSLTTSVEGIPGVSNFMLPILDGAGEPAFCIWCLDTRHYMRDHLPALADVEGTIKLPNRPKPQHKFASPTFAQQMWYWQTSCALEARYGRKIPGMMVMHVAPWEFSIAKENPAETSLIGFTDEKLSLSSLNTGIFSTALERGDIACIAAGHTHADDFVAVYCGITLTLDGCGGYAPKGNDACRGGRLFTWQNGALTTEMVRYCEN